MDVAIDPAGCDDLAFARDHFGARADYNRDPVLGVRVACLADRRDAPRNQAYIGLPDALMIDDDRIGNDRVDRALCIGALALAHAVADHLAAAELDFIARHGCIALDLDNQVGIGETQPVAGGGAEHVRVVMARHHMGHQISPFSAWPRNPEMVFVPR